MKRIIIASALLVAACTPQQQQDAAKYQQQIATACGIAMALTSGNPAIAPWIIGGCATEEAIARLALDPNSLAWLNDLIAKARGPVRLTP